MVGVGPQGRCVARPSLWQNPAAPPTGLCGFEARRQRSRRRCLISGDGKEHDALALEFAPTSTAHSKHALLLIACTAVSTHRYSRTGFLLQGLPFIQSGLSDSVVTSEKGLFGALS